MVRNVLDIFMEHDLNILMIFGITEKSIFLTHTVYCYLLTAFVLQGHISAQLKSVLISMFFSWTVRDESSPQAFDDVSTEQRASQTLNQIEHGQYGSVHVKPSLRCGTRTRNTSSSSSSSLPTRITMNTAYSHGNEILSRTGVLGRITIREYT